MTSYIESTRMPNEAICYEAHLSVWSLAPNFIMGAVFLAASVYVYGFSPEALNDALSGYAMLALAIPGFIMIGSALITFYTTEIAVTDMRVIAKVGLIRRKTMEMLLEKVESLQIDQSYLGRLLDYGTVTISAAGEENTRIASVAEPAKVKRSYYETHEANKLRHLANNQPQATQRTKTQG